jgi:hypothetical protein
MARLTGDQILDGVTSIIPDSDTTLRTKFLLWFNYISTKLGMDRIEWSCLRKTASLAVTANKITLPSDFGKLVYVKQAGVFYLEQEHLLNDKEEYEAATNSGTLPTRMSIDEVAGTVAFYPGATGTVTLGYVKEPAAIVDSTDQTDWPQMFKGIFLRAGLDFFYEYDMDVRAVLSYQLDAAELAVLYEWEISKRPVPHYEIGRNIIRGG